MTLGFKYLARTTVLVVVVMGALHVTWSAIASTAVSRYYQERIFDIHRLSGEKYKWMAAYIKSEVSDEMALAAGSSFTFLYPFDEAYTYTAELNRRGIRTANISATGYGAKAMHDAILCPLIQQNKRPRAIVLEVSLINEIAAIRDAGVRASVGDHCPDVRVGGLFQFTLTHPLGVDWFSVARDQFYKIAPPEKPSLGVVPDSYFPTAADFAEARPMLESNIKSLYARAKSISDSVAMFVTPVYYDGVAVVGRDAQMVRAQFEATLEICKRTAGPDCLDTSALITESNFANITHFNATGAKALADLIAPKIVR